MSKKWEFAWFFLWAVVNFALWYKADWHGNLFLSGVFSTIAFNHWREL